MTLSELIKEKANTAEVVDPRRLNAQVTRMINKFLLESDTREARDYTSIRCECGVLGCMAPVVVEHEKLAAIRSDPGIFIVAPGHSIDEDGELVEKTLNYALIRYREIEQVVQIDDLLASLAAPSS